MSFVENKPAWQNPRNIRNVAYVALRLNNPIFLMPWLRSVLRDSKEQLVMPDRAGGRKILPSRTNHRKNYRHQRFLRGYPNRRSGTVCLAVPDGSLFRYVWVMFGWFWMFCFSKDDPLCYFMFMFIEFERHHWGLIHWWSHWWENNHDTSTRLKTCKKCDVPAIAAGWGLFGLDNPSLVDCRFYMPYSNRIYSCRCYIFVVCWVFRGLYLWTDLGRCTSLPEPWATWRAVPRKRGRRTAALRRFTASLALSDFFPFFSSQS